jgi:hypothetical protein
MVDDPIMHMVSAPTVLTPGQEVDFVGPEYLVPHVPGRRRGEPYRVAQSFNDPGYGPVVMLEGNPELRIASDFRPRTGGAPGGGG